MKNKSIFLATAGGLVVATLLAIFMRTNLTTHTKQQPELSQTDISELKKEVVSLKHEVADLKVIATASPLAEEESPQEDNTTADMMRTLTAQLEDLKSQITELQRKQTNDLPEADSGQDEIEAGRKVVELQQQREQEAIQAKMEYENYFQRIETEFFLAEGVDNNWSIPITESIQSSLNNSPDPSQQIATKINNIECRSTTCRVEVVHDDLLSREMFNHALFSSTAGQADKFKRKQEIGSDGKIKEIIFLNREGYSFPK